MNALNQAIKTVTDVTLANAAADSAINWSVKQEASVYEASEARRQNQAMTVEAPCGSKVEVIGSFATGNMHSHCRISFKVNGKRAKGADVEAMFKAEAAKPKLLSADDRRAMGRLVGM